MTSAILSIQSEVVTGHVGNAAARLALQRLGHEAWTVPTVLLSSHAGHPGFAGEPVAPALFGKLLDALAAQGRLAEAAGILSGYLGAPEQAPLVAAAVERAKAYTGTRLYCLDPAFGDDGRIYARPGVMEAMRDTLLPLADITTPNAFELSTLSGIAVTDTASAVAAAESLGRPIVVVTSVPVEGGLGTLLVAEDTALLATTPKIVSPPRGAGDLIAALLFGHMVAGRAIGEALERAVLSTYHVLEKSSGQPEMALVAEQDALAAPPRLEGFRLETIAVGSRSDG
ncbi:MAG TPA: pyridoxal kinase [Devosia sp.]|nr:pyridoxal kinase [Devosia sp.]